MDINEAIARQITKSLNRYRFRRRFKLYYWQDADGSAHYEIKRDRSRCLYGGLVKIFPDRISVWIDGIARSPGMHIPMPDFINPENNPEEFAKSVANKIKALPQETKDKLCGKRLM